MKNKFLKKAVTIALAFFVSFTVIPFDMVFANENDGLISNESIERIVNNDLDSTIVSIGSDEDYAEPCYIDNDYWLQTETLYSTYSNGSDYRRWAQGDSRWGSLRMGSPGDSVSNAGCAATSVTKLIIQSGLRDSSSFNVGTFVNSMNNVGGFTSGGGIYWGKPSYFVSGFSYVDQHYSPYTKYDSTTSDFTNTVINWINEGYHLVIGLPYSWTSNGLVELSASAGEGHWVAVDEAMTLSTGKVHIMDSLGNTAGNADITLTSRYKLHERVIRYKGGSTPSINVNPTYARISTQDNRTEFLTGEEVNFKMESDGTAHYTIGIDRDGQRILTADVGTYKSEYNYLLTEPGSYSVYVSNYYMDGTNHVESNVVEFNVLPRLLAPNVSVQVNGKNVRLSWDPVQFATHYDVRIYYEDGTHYEDYWGGIPAETYIDLELPINQKFYAQVCSSNIDYGNFTYCNPVYFETGVNCPSLKAPDVNVNVNGRNVRLSWDAVENATHYDVRIYYADGTSYEDYWGGSPAETYKDLVLPADTKFCVQVCSANVDYGNFTYCSPIYFETGHDVPTWAKVSISNNKPEFYVGDEITFKMEADVADNFCIAIFDGDERVETVFLDKGISEYTYTANKAGTYSAYISASVNNGLEYVDSERISFTVKDKIVPTVSVSGTCTYNGTAIIPTVIVKVGNTTLTKGTDYTVIATNNINAGTANYTVKATGNYKFADITGTFTIEKAKAAVTTAPTAIGGLKYDGTSKALVTAGTAANGTMVYSTDGVTYSSSIPTATAAGTYNVYYKAEGSGNYTDSAVGKLTVTIGESSEIIKSISVSSQKLIVIYGYAGSTVSSRTVNVAFGDATVEMIDWMYANDTSCTLLADYVNAFTSKSSSYSYILTEAQVKAIEYVLDYDFGN